MRTKLSMKKKTAATITAGFLVAGTAAGAYAYWTTSGSGTGTATNAAANGTVVLHAAFAAGLTPGGQTTVTYTADNAGTSNLYVGTITPTISIDATHVSAGCLVGDFSISPTVSNVVVPAGTSAVAAGTGTLSFANTTANQDGCKGATVTLTLASN